MKFHIIVAAEQETPDRPYVIEARSDEMVTSDPQGWRDAVARESIGAHVAAFAVELPDADVLARLFPDPQPPMPAELVDPA